MKNKIREIIGKKYSFTIAYGCFIICFSIFIVLDAIVIPKEERKVPQNESYAMDLDENSVIVEEDKYKDNNIQITISYDRYCDSNIYIADVKISDYKYLRTAFAKNIYGRNITSETSKIAKDNNAIFAVNGDYYGFRDFGFVIRNGVVYRKSARQTGRDDIMIYYTDGSVKFAHERTTIVENEILQAKKEGKEIYHLLSFGPTLIDDKVINSTEENEDTIVNPRTAFGFYEPLHYVFVCVDGRTDESRGITLKELAEYMKSLNCRAAYNLDGGSSSTMYFNNRVINKPSDSFERGVSDIVYIGY